jgi:hypothetical protein
VRRRALLAGSLVTALLLGAAPAHAFTLETVPGTYAGPVHVSGPPGDATRVLVVERAGRIQLVKNGVKAAAPYLDISARVDTDAEEGLLSMAFPSPDRFYVLFTEDVGAPAGSDIVVERYDVDGTGDAADPTTRTEILRIPHRVGNNHYGGQLQIGPDSNLWLSTGDGGGVSRDSDGNAQNPGDRLGKILRIAPREAGGYDIPAGNPYASGGGAPEVWARGLRNPWRWSFDRATGDMLIADVGESDREEIDVAPAPGLGCGANFGWPWFEGTLVLGSGAAPATHHAPAFEHTHDEGWQAITGGFVIRDPAVEEAGRYVYGDFYVDQLWLYDPVTGANAATGVTVDGLAAFGEDGVGRVYAISLGGTVHRIESNAGTNGEAASRASVQVPGCDPTTTTTTQPGPGGEQPPAGGGDPPRDVPATTPPPAGGPAPLRLSVTTLRRQRAARRRRVFVLAGCDVPCRLRLTGRLTIGRASFRLTGSEAVARAGTRRPLMARLGPRARRAARRALRRGDTVAARLSVRAAAPDGRTTARSLTVAVRR